MTSSVFERGEVTLAHTVDGLIITLATVVEVVHDPGIPEAGASPPSPLSGRFGITG